MALNNKEAVVEKICLLNDRLYLCKNFVSVAARLTLVYNVSAEKTVNGRVCRRKGEIRRDIICVFI